MKRLLLYTIVTIVIMPIFAKNYPPASFRLGTYTVIERQDYYDSQNGIWKSMWFNDTLTLCSDFRFMWKSYSYYGTSDYSYGYWEYKNGAFVLNSVKGNEDTLQLQLEWMKEHTKYGPTSRHFPAYSYQEIINKKLYNIRNAGVLFKRKNKKVLMSYDLGQECDFHDFLYRFIHDGQFQDMTLNYSLRHADDMIIIDLPNTNKTDVIYRENDQLNKDLIRNQYSSLRNSPYAFDKLPPDYTIQIDSSSFDIQCIFRLDDMPIYKMTFSKYSQTWFLESIEVFEGGKGIIMY